jgi:hypothetical protein
VRVKLNVLTPDWAAVDSVSKWRSRSKVHRSQAECMLLSRYEETAK